jgi:hypothetical protein
MINRRRFAAMGVSAGALAAFANSALGQVAGEHAHGGVNEKMEECAKACSDCQRACDSCATHCAQQLKAGKQDHLDTLMTCQDCADVCVAASQIVSRGGPFATTICRTCADICAMCGAACEKFSDDEIMKMCAAECRKCEKACRAMV